MDMEMKEENIEAKDKRRPVYKDGAYDIELANGETISLSPGVDAAGVDLSGCDLSMMKLDHVHFEGANFSNCLLGSTDFSYCNLKDAIFDEAELKHTIFWGAKLMNASFKQIDGVGTRFDEADLSHVEMSGLISRANFSRATAISAHFFNLDLQACIFNDSNFTGALFEECPMMFVRLHDCDMTGATFKGCHIEYADFTDATLFGATFDECDSDDDDCSIIMTNANAQFARFIRCGFRQLDGQGMNLSGAYFELSQFFGSRFSEADFTGVTAISTGFNECHFHQAIMKKADFVLCRFRLIEAALTSVANVKFSNCFFQGSNLEDAHLEKATFDNCQFSPATTWPNDFLLPLSALEAEHIPDDIRELDEE